MPKLKMAKKEEKEKDGDLITMGIMPLFIVAACIVFSLVFTVMMVPLAPLQTDIKFVFIMLLVVSTTVASAVTIILYVFFLKKRLG